MEIHAHQVKAFEQEAWRRFEVELLEHSKVFSPRLSAVLGDDQLLIALRAAMARAWAYGFTNRGPIRLFVELVFLFGSSFDTDPQYSRLGKVLGESSEQMVRAEQMHEGHNTYLAEVSGALAINERNALRELSIFVKPRLLPSFEEADAKLRRELMRVFPQKARYIGEAGITELIEKGRSEAAMYGFHTARQVTLIAALMFAFGHGCTNDPLYPWIALILQDESIASSEDRAGRLESKTVNWLTYLLDNADSGAQR